LAPDWNAAAGSTSSSSPRETSEAGNEPTIWCAKPRDHEEHRAQPAVMPNAIVVPVANPLDAMSQALRLNKFWRVIGMAGVLD
jgi:hypothetical protein